MKIPINILEQPKEIELRMLEFILQSSNFLDDLMKLVIDQSHPIHKLSQGSLCLIIDKLDQYIQIAVDHIQKNPSFKCQMLLSLINCMMELECYRKLFNSLEHLFNMLEYSDNLLVYEQIMLILIKIYKQPLNTSNPQQKDFCNQQQIEYLPRAIYFTRILLDHYNNLSFTKIELIDYFNEDPHYQTLCEAPIEFPKLVLEYMEPTLMNESYQDLCKNGIHKKELQQQIQIRNFEITDVNSITAIALSKTFLNTQDQNFCPLVDAMKYKILIYRGFQQNRIPTISIIVVLHIQSLLMHMLLNQFCQINNCGELLDQVFEEQLEYEQHFKIYMKLFQLKTIDPQLLSTLLLTLDEIITIEKQNENEVAFNIAKNYDETFLQYIYDILSMHPISIETEQIYPLQYFPTLLSESCAKHQKLAQSIFQIFSSEPGILILSRTNIALGSSSALIRALQMQDNKLLLPPESFKAAILLLSRLSRKDDIQRDLRIFNDLIKIVENQIKFNINVQKPTQNGYSNITSEEADQIIAICIQSINEHFRDDLGRRPNRANAPTFARQISESTIIKQLQKLFITSPHFIGSIQQSLIVISHLANEVPTLIGRLIDSHLPQTLNQIIQNMSIEKINYKMMTAIFQFYFNISLKEEGYEKFNSYGMIFLKNIVNYSLIDNLNSPREQLSGLAQCITKYTQKIDKVGPQVCEILNQAVERLRIHLIEKKKQLTISNIYTQYFEIITQIQNLSILSFKMFHYPHYSYLAEMNSRGFFDSLLMFFEFPTFDFKNDLLKVFRWLTSVDEYDNPHKILKKTIFAIDKWEESIGCNLEKSKYIVNVLYYNAQKLFQSFSQQQIQDNLQMASLYSQVEYLLEILKLYLINSPQINWEQQDLINLHNKCCGLFQIILGSVIFNEEDTQNDQAFKKSVFYSYIQSLKHVIVNSFNLIKRKNSELNSLIILFNQMSQKLQNDNTQIMILYISQIDELLINLFESKRLPENKYLNLDFISLLLQSQFTQYLQEAIHSYTKMTLQNQNEQLNILSKHFSSIIKILYINKFEKSNTDFGYSILPQQISDIQAMLQITQFSNSDYIYNIQFVLIEKVMMILSPTFLQDMIIKEKDRLNFFSISSLREDFGNFNMRQQNDSTQARDQLRSMGFSDDAISIAFQNIRIPDVSIAAMWLSDNQEKVESNKLEKKEYQRNEFSVGSISEIIQHKQQELRIYIKTNILFFSKFEETLFKIFEGQMMPSLLMCLKQAVQEQFKLQLRFKDCELDLKQPFNNDIKLIITILHYIYKQQNLVQEYDYIVIEMMKLIQELLKYEDEQIIRAVNHVLAILTLFITDDQKQNKYHYENLNEILIGVLNILKGKVQNHTTSKICIEILVRAFQINKESVHKFVYQMRGLEYLLKVKGDSKNNLYSLTKLVLSIVHDSSIVIAQVEAKIKKIIYDQEYNKEIENFNKQIQQQQSSHPSYQNSYPSCFKPIYYNLQIPNEIKLSKDNQALMAIQNQCFYSEQIKFVMNSLFEDQSYYYILKKGVHLYTFDCVEPVSFQKYKEPESTKRSNKTSTKKKRSEDKLQLQSNFQHTQEAQILIKLLIQQMIISYFDKTEPYQFQWNTISQVLQVLIRRYPILIPKLVRINCSKFLKPYHKSLGLDYNEIDFPRKISFISLITKIMIPIKNLLFELCLDNVILNQMSNNSIAPFSIEVRRKIINDIYDGIEKRIKILDQNFCHLSDTLVFLIQIKSVAKICFKNVNELQNSFNFVKLYIDGMKNFDLKSYYIYENEIQFINETLAVLFNVAAYLLLYKPSLIVIPKQHQEQQGDHFQLQGMVGQLLPEDINCQLIPNKGIIYQDPIKYFIKWPLLPISFHEEMRQSVRQDDINLQHLWSPFRRRNRFLNMEVFENIENEEDEFEIDHEDDDDNDIQSVESRYDSSNNIQESAEEEFDLEVNSWITSQSGNNQIEAEDPQNINSSWTDEEDDQAEEDDGQDDDVEDSNDSDDDNASNSELNIINQQDIDQEILERNVQDLEQNMQQHQNDQNHQVSKQNKETLNHYHHLTNKEDLIFMKMTKSIIQLIGVKFSQQFVKILDKFNFLLPESKQVDDQQLINWWTELTSFTSKQTISEETILPQQDIRIQPLNIFRNRLGIDFLRIDQDDRFLARVQQGSLGRTARNNLQQIIRDFPDRQSQFDIILEQQRQFQEQFGQQLANLQQQNAETIELQIENQFQIHQSQHTRQQNHQQLLQHCQNHQQEQEIQNQHLHQSNQINLEVQMPQQQLQGEENNQKLKIDQSEKIEQHSIQQQQQQQQQQNNQNYSQIYPKSYNLLKRVGKKFEDLIKNDIDPSVFEDLNEDIMMEIVLALPKEIDGIDPQFLASLPSEIRNEIIQQYSAPINQTPPPQQQFTVVDLSQDLIINNNSERNQLQNHRGQHIIPPINISQQNPTNFQNRLNSRTLNYRSIFQNQLVNEYRIPIQEEQVQQRKPQSKSQNLKNLLQTQRHIISKLGTVEDEFTESLLNLLYVESHSFINFPINLFISLCNNQNVEHKLIDTLFFILKTNKSKDQDQAKSFPPRFLVKRNGLVRDFSKIYNVVSLKVLYLFSKLQGFSINYFFENQKQNLNSSENSLSFPLLQLIQLLPEFQGDHQEMLIQAITNISTKQKNFQQDKVKLDQKSVECICKTLLSNMGGIVKNFSNIIQSLCNNKENQLLIVQYIKEYIEKAIREINEKFQREQQYDEIFNGDKALINVFQFVREINTKGNDNQQDVRLNFKELLENQELIELWKNMITFLQQIPQQQIIKLTPKISPYLECFFIIYQIVNPIKKNRLNQKESKKIAMMEEQYEEVKEQQLHDELFQQICESGKALLNMMLKERFQEYKEKGKITNDSLGIIIFKNPRIVDFDNKQKYFKMELKQLKIQNNKHHYGNIAVRCRRKDIFMDSYHRFSKLKPEDLKGKLTVEFDGEEGIDQGGVTREWFLMLSKEIFNPNYALFTPSLNGQMFQPSNKSHVNPDHVKYFKFIGRIVGKALYDGQLLDTYFTRSFYKHILGQKLTIHDMEDIDLNEYKSMKKILEENVNDWGIYWTYTVDNFGKLEERELVEGGRQKQVTEDNKFEYVQTYCYQKMAKEIKDQIEAFLNGFHELIPQNLISIFEWKEMELMLCGLPDIDLEDMKENVEYHGYDREDKVIQWLWELLESFDESKRAAFLQFITGTSKVPLGGFKDLKGIHGSQKIQIHKKHYINFELPTSHTCFNQLDLPCYPTRQILKEKLELAILEGKEGFGFA